MFLLLSGFLTVILSERYTPGIGQVTAEDAIRKEIIQLLCIEPTGHSTLNRALTADAVNRETGLDKVVESVAVFKKPAPGSTGRGIYELKPEHYDHFNCFFYHYTKEDVSKSSENQRRRRKEANLPQCNPPPKPPRFTAEYAKVPELMASDTFNYILSLVLHRADNLKSRCFSESQVHR